MDSPTQITVILCTHNRALRLEKALESVASQTFSKSVGWEILIVDNNSSDDTRQVVETFQHRYPERIRYVFEPQQGVSFARNSGVRHAEGKILAFIDDDEIADREWLHNLTSNLFEGEWAGAGGRVLPQWNGVRPTRWLLSWNSFICGPLAMFDPEMEGGRLTEPPFGANMAFRKEVFERHGGFRTDLGRSGKAMLSGEDTEFGRRLIAAGEQLRYEPLAVTNHPVDGNRINKEYFLLWWFNKGRTDIREFGIQSHRTNFFGIPLRLFLDASLEAVRWMVTVEPSRRFICKLKVWTYVGQGFESYNQSFDAKRKKPECKADSQPS